MNKFNCTQIVKSLISKYSNTCSCSVDLNKSFSEYIETIKIERMIQEFFEIFKIPFENVDIKNGNNAINFFSRK